MGVRTILWAAAVVVFAMSAWVQQYYINSLLDEIEIRNKLLAEYRDLSREQNERLDFFRGFSSHQADQIRDLRELLELANNDVSPGE